jgi:hypothetical protein
MVDLIIDRSSMGRSRCRSAMDVEDDEDDHWPAENVGEKSLQIRDQYLYFNLEPIFNLTWADASMKIQPLNCRIFGNPWRTLPVASYQKWKVVINRGPFDSKTRISLRKTWSGSAVSSFLVERTSGRRRGTPGKVSQLISSRVHRAPLKGCSSRRWRSTKRIHMHSL